MNPARLLALLVSLPLLLGGCGEKHVSEVKAELDGVNYKELEISENLFNEIAYHKGSPYTGKSFELYGGKKAGEANWKNGKRNGLTLEWYDNGQKYSEKNFQDGKVVGLFVTWHDNGQKMYEKNFKDGKGISEKFWNNKGEPVDSMEEAIEE